MEALHGQGGLLQKDVSMKEIFPKGGRWILRTPRGDKSSIITKHLSICFLFTRYFVFWFLYRQVKPKTNKNMTSAIFSTPQNHRSGQSTLNGTNRGNRNSPTTCSATYLQEQDTCTTHNLTYRKRTI